MLPYALGQSPICWPPQQSFSPLRGKDCEKLNTSSLPLSPLPCFPLTHFPPPFPADNGCKPAVRAVTIDGVRDRDVQFDTSLSVLFVRGINKTITDAEVGGACNK